MSTTKTKSRTRKKKAAYTQEQVMQWYEQALMIRRFEEKAGQLYMQGKFRGFCHLYIGQEAVAVGIEGAIRPDDYVITAYRDHGGALVRGVTPNACMAELYGKATGCSKGKGGSMHFFSKEHNFMGGHGIVGGQIPLGAGIAFGSKYKGGDNVTVCLMGDGATRQGALHEAFNLAMLWELPVIFVIENNAYAMGTSVERTSNVTELHKLGLSYDMPSVSVDAMSTFEVYDAMTAAVEHARSGKGPMLMEMKTYRYRGHSMSDPMKYRTRDELNEFKDRDPIVGLKLYLLENDMATEEQLKEIDTQIKATVAESVTFAEQSPYPDVSALYEDVYVGDYPYIMD
ncbi:pyruvate dehydrogenase (acetyl-transferring) E1 component subunit alpha [Pontibacter sp. G13]|uniref:pyruvate dehydrogenase (acetyl-transferring) E1 component subunit alpha n=1 Tax=Pontibacter sp. G13 TaxID=3074898 RepID=UPI00288AF251|nr:pyruvate dehydrogenase (acetyl-transferring) E1 component subunit alpha [Pontibacter sp. G13]WNJ16302.1 pyruvate dehydrogenase (acetyl-transferring) E1 component subunit alpha [Pontibacter sp. G13]